MKIDLFWKIRREISICIYTYLHTHTHITLSVNYFISFISTFKIISSNLGMAVWVRNAYPRVCYLKTWFSLIWRHSLGSLKRYNCIEERMSSEISLGSKALTISNLSCLLCALCLKTWMLGFLLCPPSFILVITTPYSLNDGWTLTPLELQVQVSSSLSCLGHAIFIMCNRKETYKLYYIIADIVSFSQKQ